MVRFVEVCIEVEDPLASLLHKPGCVWSVMCVCVPVKQSGPCPVASLQWQRCELEVDYVLGFFDYPGYFGEEITGKLSLFGGS